MSVSPASFAFVAGLVHRRAGIVLEPGKEYLVDARLGPLALEVGAASVDVLVERLRREPADPELVRRAVESLTTNETSFFRDLHPFEALKQKILPDLIAAARTRRSLRIWCAAASTGQEPYSIAMMLRDAFPELASWELRIDATDINRAVVERAQSGIFRQLEVNRGLPARFLVKYFEKAGLDWQIRPEIRKMVRFSELNLLERWPHRAPYDVVMMRNVLIYFDVATKKDVLARLPAAMTKGGYLFLGGGETTIGSDFTAERMPGPSIAYVRNRNLHCDRDSSAL